MQIRHNSFLPEILHASDTKCRADDRVVAWLRDEGVKNFGDFLALFICEEALIAPVFQAARYRLLGSAFDNGLLSGDLAELGEEEVLACWGCGARDASPLAPEIMARLAIFGVRGPLTRDALQLPADTPMGDPGLLMPLLYEARANAETLGKTLCIPHLQEPLDHDTIASLTGADVIVSPGVRDMDDVRRVIDAIVSSEFVLAGSLHAAIIAFAYQRPFAFMNLGFVDVPFKWEDFSALIGIDARFADNVTNGLEIWRDMQAKMIKPKLAPLLACCPWAAKPWVMVKALEWDRGGRSTAASSLCSDAMALEKQGALFKEACMNSTSCQSYTFKREAFEDNLDLALADAKTLTSNIMARIEAARFSFTEPDGQGVLHFGAGRAGSVLIAGDWAPANEIGPVSSGTDVRIILEHATNWAQGDLLCLECYIYAPKSPPFNGARTVKVHLNGVSVFDQKLRNQGEQESIATVIRLPIPQRLARLRGKLIMQFSFSPMVSPFSVGLGSDKRLVGFAPLHMWLEKNLSSSVEVEDGVHEEERI